MCLLCIFFGETFIHVPGSHYFCCNLSGISTPHAA